MTNLSLQASQVGAEVDGGKVKFLFKSDLSTWLAQMVLTLCTAFRWLTFSCPAHSYWSRLMSLRIVLARTRELVGFLDQLVLQTLVVLSQVLNFFFLMWVGQGQGWISESFGLNVAQGL